MGNISDKLQYLAETKEAIKEAIKAKGVEVAEADTFRSYADRVSNIAVAVDSNAPVKLYGYDGTLLHSYSAEAFQLLEDLPELPTHAGLIANGWNFDIDYMKNTLYRYGFAASGALYVTDDNTTRLYVNTDEDGQGFALEINATGNVVVDWGDETPSETGTGTLNLQHSFEHAGNYIVRISGDDSYSIKAPPYGAAWFEPLPGIGIEVQGAPYDYSLNRIETSQQCTYVRVYCAGGLSTISAHSNCNVYLFSCPAIKAVVAASCSCNMCSSVDVILSRLSSASYCPRLEDIISYDMKYSVKFDNCSSLKRIAGQGRSAGANEYKYFTNNYALEYLRIDGSNAIGGSAFENCHSLRTIHGFTKIKSLGERAFHNCWNLSMDIVLDTSITEIPDAFRGCHSLKKIKALGNIERVDSYALADCKNLEVLDFSANRLVAHVGKLSDYWSPTHVAIIVPDSLYDEWIVAANWSTYASQIVKASEYNG